MDADEHIRVPDDAELLRKRNGGEVDHRQLDVGNSIAQGGQQRVLVPEPAAPLAVDECDDDLVRVPWRVIDAVEVEDTAREDVQRRGCGAVPDIPIVLP